MRYRVAIILKSGEVIAKNFQKREDVDDFILTNEYKRYRILDRKINKIIESENGVLPETKI